jgi:hypothetical protein
MRDAQRAQHVADLGLEAARVGTKRDAKASGHARLGDISAAVLAASASSTPIY